ncbi:MAG: hypothetical protein A4S12_00910 [Proteobacteria bacterium SG_bin5]|nr:hypothetical protein [Sphingomonas sp.]OQW42230.1 MAG: hypothetical protein A4S12_00910 [Proteobacteria bacterium SG_bin5]
MKPAPMLALLAPGLLAAAADRPIPVATPAGPPELCLIRSRIQNNIVRSDRVIDFVLFGGKVYRVTLPQDCPDLGAQRAFAYASTGNQLCASDQITILYNAPMATGARCALAPFQPVVLQGGWKAAR